MFGPVPADPWPPWWPAWSPIFERAATIAGFVRAEPGFAVHRVPTDAGRSPPTRDESEVADRHGAEARVLSSGIPVSSEWARWNAQQTRDTPGGVFRTSFRRSPITRVDPVGLHRTVILTQRIRTVARVAFPAPTVESDYMAGDSLGGRAIAKFDKGCILTPAFTRRCPAIEG